VSFCLLAAGGQATFIMAKKNLALFLRYEHEFASYSRALGNTCVLAAPGHCAYLNPLAAKARRDF
jgi:hypothetical protein